MLDLSPMKQIRVDASAKTVIAEAGVNWGEFDAATQQHGLATTGGRVTTTGIAGLTLGTGSGWLERLHGYTADNLISADVVTADGRSSTRARTRTRTSSGASAAAAATSASSSTSSTGCTSCRR